MTGRRTSGGVVATSVDLVCKTRAGTGRCPRSTGPRNRRDGWRSAGASPGTVPDVDAADVRGEVSPPEPVRGGHPPAGPRKRRPAQRRRRSSTAYPQHARAVLNPTPPPEASGVRRDAGRGAQPTTDDQLFIKPCVPAASRLPPLSRRCPSWPAVVVPPPTGVRRSTSPPCKRVRRGRWRIALLGRRLLPLGA
jgi:hypothetical protein